MRDHNEIDNRIRVYDAHVFSSRFDGDLSKIKIKEGNGIALFTISEIDSHPVYWGCKHIIEKFYLYLLEKRSWWKIKNLITKSVSKAIWQ